MTSKRELMQKVFHNEPAERVPVGFWFHFLTDDQLNSAVAHPELMEKATRGIRRTSKRSIPTSSRS